jgi:hypothetical protein
MIRDGRPDRFFDFWFNLPTFGSKATLGAKPAQVSIIGLI